MAKKKGRDKDDYKSMSVQELEARLREAEESRFRLQFRHAGNPLKNPMQIRTVRREVARLKTWLGQKGSKAS
jgi:large subunit ribosomal protein L29